MQIMNNTSPKVSVIISTLNRADYLIKTLDSLNEVQYDNFEVIVVNGPSTDSTSVVLGRFKDVRIFEVSQANLGISRNLGIKHSTGEYIAFIDDDCIPGRFWLSELVESISSENVDGIGGMIYDVPTDTFLWERVMSDNFGNVTVNNSNQEINRDYSESKKFLYLPTCNALFKRSSLISVGGFNRYIKYGYDDVEMSFRLISNGFQLKYIDSAKVDHYRAPSYIRNEKYEILDDSVYLRSQIIFVYQSGNPNNFLKNRLFVKKLYREKKINLRRRFDLREITRSEYHRLSRKLMIAKISGQVTGLRKRPFLTITD
jgi:glycosyltransferase involved in cell wall biosynthesis